MRKQPSKLYFQKGTLVGIMEKGGEKTPVRKDITNSLIGDRVSMKNKDVAQQEEKGKTEPKTCEAAAKKKKAYVGKN